MNKLKLAGCIALIGCNIVAFGALNPNDECAVELALKKRDNAASFLEYIETMKAIEKKFHAHAQKLLEAQIKVNGATAEDSATSIPTTAYGRTAYANYEKTIGDPLFKVIMETGRTLTRVELIALEIKTFSEVGRDPELLAQLQTELNQTIQRIRRASNELVLHTGIKEAVNCDSTAEAAKIKWANEEHNTETRNRLQSIFERQ